MTQFLQSTVGLNAVMSYTDIVSNSKVSITHYQISPMISYDVTQCNIKSFSFNSKVEKLWFQRHYQWESQDGQHVPLILFMPL